MTLNATGPISLGGGTAGQSINLELGQSATAQVSLNDTNVRTLAAVPSGAIVMPTNFYGKSNFTPGTYTFTSSGSFTLPTGYSTAVIEVWGGGGGGGVGSSPTSNSTAGGASSVSGTGVSLTSNGGSGGASSVGTNAGGAGGTATGGSTNTSGSAGGTGTFDIGTGEGIGGAGGNTAAGINAYTSGGAGGPSVDTGFGVSVAGNVGGDPGAGGGGAARYYGGKALQGYGGGGGGGGGYSRVTASSGTSPAGTVLTITVGGAGSGAIDPAGFNGGAGAAGYVVIKTA